ncbi:C2 domain-containing protein 3 [Allomyces javanicus]|nr:C2 domain-containing protein 3 [Allomyces javanicus]
MDPLAADADPDSTTPNTTILQSKLDLEPLSPPRRPHATTPPVLPASRRTRQATLDEPVVGRFSPSLTAKIAALHAARRQRPEPAADAPPVVRVAKSRLHEVPLDRLLLKQRAQQQQKQHQQPQHQYATGDDQARSELALDDMDASLDDGDLTSLTTTTDSTDLSLTALLIDDDEAGDWLDQLDMDEYALIEALNGSRVNQLDTIDLLLGRKARENNTAPSPPAAVSLPDPTPPNEPEPPARNSAASLLTNVPALRRRIVTPPPGPLVSPLSVMDAAHVAHLGHVYGIAIHVRDLSLASAAVVALQKQAGLAHLAPGPTSARALTEGLVVEIGVHLPGELGARQFEVVVRNSAMVRAQRHVSKCNSDDNDDLGACVRLTCHQHDVVPVQFDGALVQAFLTQTCAVRMTVRPRPGPRAARGARTATGAGMTGVAPVKLVHLMQADRFVYQVEVPVFTASDQFLGHVALTLALMPTMPVEKALPPSPEPEERATTPAPPPPQRVVVPEPPFPLELRISIGHFVPVATPRSAYKAFPAERAAQNVAVHVESSLSVMVRLDVPLETRAHPWTAQSVEQKVGLVMDQVQVQADAHRVNFDAQFVVPTSMAQLTPWIEAPLVVELWLHAGSVAQMDGSETRHSTSAKTLFGMAKLPLHQVLQTVLRTFPKVAWHQLLPIALLDLTCPVVDPRTGTHRGWLEAGIEVARRNTVVLSAPDTSPRPAPHSAGIAAAEPAALPTPPPLPPSATLLVRFHSAGGILTLARHVLAQLVQHEQDAHDPFAPTLLDLPGPQTEYTHALRRVLHGDALNLYVSLSIFPPAIAKRFGVDPTPFVSPIAWDAAVPAWDADDPGHELVLPRIDSAVLAWFEAPHAVAHGQIVHRFASTTSSGTTPLDDVVVGEFRIDLARLVKRSAGLADAFVAVRAPADVVVGARHVVVPPVDAVGCVHVDVVFTDTVPRALPDFAPVAVRLEMAGHVQRAGVGAAVLGASAMRRSVSADAGVHVDVDLALFQGSGTAPVTADASAAWTWSAELVLTAEVMQAVLNGRVVVHVRGVDDEPVGTAVIDTYAVAHALLRLLNGYLPADRVAFRAPVLPVESPTAISMTAVGAFVIKHGAESPVMARPVRMAQVSPVVGRAHEDPIVAADEDVPRSALLAPPRNEPPRVEPARIDVPFHDDASVLLEVTVVEAQSLPVPTSASQGPATVYVSFAWTTDASLATDLGASIRSTVSDAPDRQTYHTPAARLEAPAHVAWHAATYVAQSTKRAALARLRRKKVVVFKVWVAAAGEGVEVPTAHDRLVGFAKVDVAPLAHGMPMLDGWYNVLDFHGESCGQLHVRVRPVAPLQEEGGARPSPVVQRVLATASPPGPPAVAAAAVLASPPHVGFEASVSDGESSILLDLLVADPSHTRADSSGDPHDLDDVHLLNLPDVAELADYRDGDSIHSIHDTARESPGESSVVVLSPSASSASLTTVSDPVNEAGDAALSTTTDDDNDDDEEDQDGHDKSGPLSRFALSSSLLARASQLSRAAAAAAATATSSAATAHDRVNNTSRRASAAASPAARSVPLSPLPDLSSSSTWDEADGDDDGVAGADVSLTSSDDASGDDDEVDIDAVLARTWSARALRATRPAPRPVVDRLRDDAAAVQAQIAAIQRRADSFSAVLRARGVRGA